MASFEIQRTQATPSGRVGAVPMNINVDTGADAVGQAFASLGNRIYELQANKQNAENAIKKSELRLQYQTRTSEALRELETTFNADEQQEIIGRYQSDITALGTGIPDVDQDFTEYRNNTLAGNLDAFERTVHKNQIISLNDQFDINYQKTLETGSRQTASDLIDNMVQAGAISPERAEAMKGEWSGDMRLTRAKKMIETGDPNEIYNAETVLTFMSDQATNNPGEFTAKQMNVLDNLKTQLDATKNRKNSELREQQDKDMWEGYNRIGTPEFTSEYLDSTSLDTPSKIRLTEMHKDIVSARAKGAISQYEEGNPEVLAQVQAIIDLRPNNVTPEQIYRMADSGLGVKYIPSLVSRLEKNKEKTNPVNDNYRKELANLHRRGLFGKPDNPDASMKYLDISNRLESFLTTNPSEESLRKFYGQLVIEDMSWGRSWGANQLPGWGEKELSTTISVGGTTKDIAIQYGSVIEVEGKKYQAIGRKGGEVQWLEVK